MRSTLRLLGALSLALLLWPASGCASRAPGPKPSLPLADLSAPAKPQLTIEAVASGDAAALDRHNSAIEAWGDGMALQIARICRAAGVIGLPHPDCPPAP